MFVLNVYLITMLWYYYTWSHKYMFETVYITFHDLNKSFTGYFTFTLMYTCCSKPDNFTYCYLWKLSLCSNDTFTLMLNYHWTNQVTKNTYPITMFYMQYTVLIQFHMTLLMLQAETLVDYLRSISDKQTFVVFFFTIYIHCTKTEFSMY